MAWNVLVIDDDEDVLEAADFLLVARGMVVDRCALPEGVERRLIKRQFDAVLLDMNFRANAHDGEQGLELLGKIAHRDPSLSVVLMTAFGTVGVAVEALKRGACDFILKPWRSDILAEGVVAACRRTQALREGEGRLRLDDLERSAIARALAVSRGSVTQAAALLGLTRPALYRRIQKHEL